MTVIVARFIPIVRTFTPVAAGVGKMPRGRYTLYNFAGAMLWGFGLTMFGYLLGFIPVVGELVAEYIDLILLRAVFGTLAVTLWHYFRKHAKAPQGSSLGAVSSTDEAEARQLVLEPEVFKRGPEHGGEADEAPPRR